MWLIGQPYRRGFFCNDESIIHPFQNDTISTTVLISVGICLPVATVKYCGIIFAEKVSSMMSLQILIVELIRGKLSLDPDRDVTLFSWSVPICFQNLYKNLGFFLFGAATCQLTTDLAKYTIGRLRPHFIDVSKGI